MKLEVIDKVMERLWSLSDTLSADKIDIVKFDLHPNNYREVAVVVHFDSSVGNYEVRFDRAGYVLGYSKR